MSFIIRKAGGERSISMITNKNQRPSIREEIAEALRGMTINFELKITGVDTGEAQQSAQTSTKQDEATFAAQASSILADIKSKPDYEYQQVSSRTQNGQTNEPTQQPKPLAPTSNSMRPSTSLIRPAIGRQPPPASAETQPKEILSDTTSKMTDSEVRSPPASQLIETKVEVKKPVENVSEPAAKVNERPADTVEPRAGPSEHKKELAEPKVEPAAPKPETSKMHEPPAKPVMGTLVKGNLKVGSTMKAVCIWYDQTQTPGVPYISYDSSRLTKITGMISDMALDIEAQAIPSSIEVGSIVFAKSNDDDNWYRAIVRRVNSTEIGAYLFDWGLNETLDISRIRRLAVLELGLSSQPALAIKVKVDNPPGYLVDKFYECDSEFELNVLSYDDFDETYMIKLIAQC